MKNKIQEKLSMFASLMLGVSLLLHGVKVVFNLGNSDVVSVLQIAFIGISIGASLSIFLFRNDINKE